jgi:hypothetical protein
VRAHVVGDRRDVRRPADGASPPPPEEGTAAALVEFEFYRVGLAVATHAANGHDRHPIVVHAVEHCRAVPPPRDDDGQSQEEDEDEDAAAAPAQAGSPMARPHPR